jgi:hypothetical protein
MSSGIEGNNHYLHNYTCLNGMVGHLTIRVVIFFIIYTSKKDAIVHPGSTVRCATNFHVIASLFRDRIFTCFPLECINPNKRTFVFFFGTIIF